MQKIQWERQKKKDAMKIKTMNAAAVELVENWLV